MARTAKAAASRSTEEVWNEFRELSQVICPRCRGWVRRELAERTAKETGQQEMLHSLEACELEIVRSVIES